MQIHGAGTPPVAQAPTPLTLVLGRRQHPPAAPPHRTPASPKAGPSRLPAVEGHSQPRWAKSHCILQHHPRGRPHPAPLEPVEEHC